MEFRLIDKPEGKKEIQISPCSTGDKFQPWILIKETELKGNPINRDGAIYVLRGGRLSGDQALKMRQALGVAFQILVESMISGIEVGFQRIPDGYLKKVVQNEC